MSDATRDVATAARVDRVENVIDMATQQIRKRPARRGHALPGVLHRVRRRAEAAGRAWAMVSTTCSRQRFGLTFSEVLGDFTAELLPACVDLGINRRKLGVSLAGYSWDE